MPRQYVWRERSVPIVGDVTLPVAVIVRDSNSNLTKYGIFNRIAGEKRSVWLEMATR